MTKKKYSRAIAIEHHAHGFDEGEEIMFLGEANMYGLNIYEFVNTLGVHQLMLEGTFTWVEKE